MAGDLRMAKAVSRITVELERAGDEVEEDRQVRGATRDGRTARARCARSRATCGTWPSSPTGMLRDAVRALDESDPEHGAARVARATRSWTPSSPPRCASC